MGAIMEAVFCILYLITAIGLGCFMIRKSKTGDAARDSHPQTAPPVWNARLLRWFGVMTLVLGLGDAFHLVPRILAALGPAGPEAYTAALGFGTLVTSITMTVFYVLLYHIWRQRYGITEHGLQTPGVYILAAIRVVICLFPQNRWLDADAPVLWGIYRNIPFTLLGVLILVLFFIKARQYRDRAFRFLWLAVLLSFVFYLPVVLWADVHPMIGMLMLPKTCAYVWIMRMGLKAGR